MILQPLCIYIIIIDCLYSILYNLMNSWISSTSNWLKKQYFNSAHYIDVLVNQGDRLDEADIYIFGIKFDKDNRKQAF